MKLTEERFEDNYTRMLFWTNPGNSTLQNNCYIAIYIPSQEPSLLDEQNMLGTAGKVETNS